MGRPAQESGPRRARGRGGEREPVGRVHPAWSRVGPACQRLGSPWARCTRGELGFAEGGAAHARGSRRTRFGGPTRSLTARGGPRARGGKRRGRLAWSADPVAAEVAPTWRLHGCHADRREVDDDAGRNGRRMTAASGGANHGDTGESEHTGRLHGTRGDEPTARIRRGMLDGGGLRRRQPAAREGGNGDEVTRGRFPAVRASTRLWESVASVGLGGATPSEASDERALRSTGGDGGEHTAGGGNARTGSSGTRDGDGREMRRVARAVKRRRGGGRMTPAGREKGKRGLASLPFREKEEGEKATRQRERRALPPSLGGTRGEWRGQGDDDGDDGGGGLERSGDTGGRRGQARQRLTAAATGRSATTARARGKQRRAATI
uniref:Epstein-Barr virus EBNA-1-like n=1 Tax=Oryza glaberrima TaxID=4538 RepID=A0A679BA42_ORYGL|nr:Epstein-Barr virus EBNA-1-like [Oryza glaberrima]